MFSDDFIYIFFLNASEGNPLYKTSGQQSSHTQEKTTTRQIIKDVVDILHKSGEPATLPHTS